MYHPMIHRHRKYRQMVNDQFYGGAPGVMVTVGGNVHGDASSNPGRD